VRQYELSGPAQRDLREISDYIASDRPSAAIRVVDALRSKCQDLAEMPGMGRQRDELSPGVRSFPVLPYIVFYRESDTGIQVLRILHGARDISEEHFRS
jgi:toxin ParE1/3/4